MDVFYGFKIFKKEVPFTIIKLGRAWIFNSEFGCLKDLGWLEGE